MPVVTNKNVWPCTARWEEFRKIRNGSSGGFRYLMFSLYKEKMEILKIIHRSGLLKRQSIQLVAM